MRHHSLLGSWRTGAIRCSSGVKACLRLDGTCTETGHKSSVDQCHSVDGKDYRLERWSMCLFSCSSVRTLVVAGISEIGVAITVDFEADTGSHCCRLESFVSVVVDFHSRNSYFVCFTILGIALEVSLSFIVTSGSNL